jgi:hypothetical protein
LIYFIVFPIKTTLLLLSLFSLSAFAGPQLNRCIKMKEAQVNEAKAWMEEMYRIDDAGDRYQFKQIVLAKTKQNFRSEHECIVKALKEASPTSLTTTILDACEYMNERSSESLSSASLVLSELVNEHTTALYCLENAKEYSKH